MFMQPFAPVLPDVLKTMRDMGERSAMIGLALWPINPVTWWLAMLEMPAPAAKAGKPPVRIIAETIDEPAAVKSPKRPPAKAKLSA